MADKTDAQKRAQKKYMEKFVEVKVRMSPEKRSEIQNHAASNGESVNSLIIRSITMTMIFEECKARWRKVVAEDLPLSKYEEEAVASTAKLFGVSHDKVLQSEHFLNGLELIKRHSVEAWGKIMHDSPIPQYVVVCYPKLSAEKQKVVIDYILEQD